MIIVVHDETCHPVTHHQPTTREQIGKLGLSPSPCLPRRDEPKRRSDGGISLVVENPGRPSSSSLHVAMNTTRSSARAFACQRPLSGCSLTMNTCSRRCFRRFGESLVDARSANIGRFTRRVKFSRTGYFWRLYGLGWSFSSYRQTSIRALWTEYSDARHAITEAGSPTPPVGTRSTSISTSSPSWALSRSHSARAIVKTHSDVAVPRARPGGRGVEL